MTLLHYHHVDVFSPRAYSGNSLSVFCNAGDLSPEQMLAITQEMRHFESIFLEPTGFPRRFRARVFDRIEELDFAGHPLIGAAAVVHSTLGGDETEEWTFELKNKTVTVTTRRTPSGFSALLDQGAPTFLGELPRDRWSEFAEALGLEPSVLSERCPPEVVSTGLRYLVIPIEHGIEHVRIGARDFDQLLASVNAQYSYVIDLARMEGRHWTNDGLLEDVATGSGAGTATAYLVRHGVREPSTEWILQQGRFTGRPSEIRVRANGTPAAISNVLVGGDVALVGQGTLNAIPADLR